MTAASHQQFLSRFESALPAAVMACPNPERNVIAYRIAGPKISVQAQIARIGAELKKMPEHVNWSARFMAPMRCVDGFVSHGEVWMERGK